MLNNDLYTDVDFTADALFNQKDSLIVGDPQKAMFYYFKDSGKFYTDAKGYVPMIHSTWTREEILKANNGKMPGLSTQGETFRIVIVPNIETVYGWPQILEPSEFLN